MAKTKVKLKPAVIKPAGAQPGAGMRAPTSGGAVKTRGGVAQRIAAQSAYISRSEAVRGVSGYGSNTAAQRAAVLENPLLSAARSAGAAFADLFARMQDVDDEVSESLAQEQAWLSFRDGNEDFLLVHRGVSAPDPTYRRSLLLEHSNRQDEPPAEPTPTGRKYLDAVDRVRTAVGDVDPVLFGMIVQNEWNHRAYENALPFFAIRALGNPPSFGVAQIQSGTAIGVINQYPELFATYPQIIGSNGEPNEFAIQWELFVNEDFNLLVGAAIVGDTRNDLINALANRGIDVSDLPVEDSITVTNDQLNRLTVIAYNEGIDRYLTFIRELETSESILQRISDNIIVHDQDDIVYSQRRYIEEQVGYQLGEWP
ncbi:MAG: hypothetical protein L6Q98_21295 [Anaerolineae bacterium]|nr:hypothetical protein [Anaerolineae bacterium]NUQ06124.1 hypothetical protein [Anaerolineae bacterium]